MSSYNKFSSPLFNTAFLRIPRSLHWQLNALTTRLHLIYAIDTTIYSDCVKLCCSISAGMRGNDLLGPELQMIRDVYPGSRIRTFPSRIPDPGSQKRI
jgi:hypothetical protein